MSSSGDIIESRRVPDPRSKLKNIIDRQARAVADQLSADDSIFMEQSITASSRLTHFDQDLNYTFNGHSSTIFYTPFEPDLSLLVIHLYLENTGHYARDFALLGNRGIINGSPPLLQKGFDQANVGGFCLTLDGDTNFIDIPNKNNISFSLFSSNDPSNPSSFSFCCFVNPSNISLDDNGKRRIIAAKTDDAANSFILGIDVDGTVFFHVKCNSTEYKVKAPQVVNSTNPSAWYSIVAVFDAVSTPKSAKIYFNNLLYTTTSTITQAYPPYILGTSSTQSNLDIDFHIGRQDSEEVYIHGGFDPAGYDPNGYDTTVQIYAHANGAFSGGMQDVRLYMKALSAAEINNLYTNKFSIYDIAALSVGLAGFSVANT